MWPDLEQARRDYNDLLDDKPLISGWSFSFDAKVHISAVDDWIAKKSILETKIEMLEDIHEPWLRKQRETAEFKRKSYMERHYGVMGE